MNLVVFLGPTLSVEQARVELDAIYLPPVAQGDVYRAALRKPFAIGIVDGYFERLPAVWHKEILWALSQGIHVFGAASMGALRAAELDRFGMIGVGAVYRAFASGELEDDDEVAVAHGEVDTGYRALSEAMVNIRATLAVVREQGHVSDPMQQRLLELAKGMFYPDRCYPHLWKQALDAGLSEQEVEMARSGVRSQRVDQKREDAIQLLQALNACAKLGAPPAATSFALAHTEAWDQVVDSAHSQPALF